MWMFGRNTGRAVEVVETGEHDVDEHAIWGVGGPAMFPVALLDELVEALDELPALLDAPSNAASSPQA